MKEYNEQKYITTIGLIVMIVVVTLAAIPTSQAERVISNEPTNIKAVSLELNGGLVTTDQNSGLTPTDVVDTLLGSGVTVSNVQSNCANIAMGTFIGGTGIIGLESGIILSSGNIANVIGPNVNDEITAVNDLPGDSDLDDLIPGYTTYDACVLEFDFIPATSSIQFNYVFTSEEYNEYVYSSFNDVFGFFLNGQNIALLPDGETPVSINNVNCGNPYDCTAGTNPAYYINNDLSDGGGAINTEMDGLTVVLTAVANVDAGQINHIKLVIADAGDYVLDSNVFIEAESFVSPQLTLEPLYSTNYVGETHTLTATLVDENEDPVPGETITFTVISGPHVSYSGTGTTDANGIATWSYTGTAEGIDTIVATTTGYDQTSNPVTKTWEAPPFTVKKDFRHTKVNFVPTEIIDPDGIPGTNDEYEIQLPAELGELLPDVDGDYKFEVKYVIKPKDKTVSSTNPGQIYGVKTIEGAGVETVNMVDAFGTQFDVNPDKRGGGVEILRIDANGLATILTDDLVQVPTVVIDNTAGTVTVDIDLASPLEADENLMIYIKYKTALKGLLPDFNDFANENVVTINDGITPMTASAIIEFV